MTQPTSDLVSLFWEHMPRQYLERVLRAIFDCYEAADEKCDAEFAKTEAVNVRPFYRRGLIEGALREAAESFPQITASARRSVASGWNHTLIICGGVALTENAVGGPEEIVRASLFRKTYAGKDNQRYLFPELKPEEAPLDSLLYGILIHGQPEGSAKFPAFAKIVFPKEDLESYWPGHIDLFQVFPNVVRAKTERPFGTAASVEQIAEPHPELRSVARRVAGET